MDILSFCNSFPFEYYSYNGIPRHLIRGFMKDYLPKCILYPILKTGRQSTDWILRLQSSKDTIINEFQRILHNDYSNKYLNTVEIRKFLDSNIDFSVNNQNEYSYMIFAYIFSKYFENSISFK